MFLGGSPKNQFIKKIINFKIVFFSPHNDTLDFGGKKLRLLYSYMRVRGFGVWRRSCYLVVGVVVHFYNSFVPWSSLRPKQLKI
jgi:hypothetical protein